MMHMLMVCAIGFGIMASYFAADCGLWHYFSNWNGPRGKHGFFLRFSYGIAVS